jgi:hypothetical protein
MRERVRVRVRVRVREKEKGEGGVGGEDGMTNYYTLWLSLLLT